MIAIPDPFILNRPELSRCDIIGDVHGCYDELVGLLHQLGHDNVSASASGTSSVSHLPHLIFVGDIVDRGDRNLDCLQLVMHLCRTGKASMVMGNHDFKFYRWLCGHTVVIKHGLERTIAEIESLPAHTATDVRNDICSFFESVPNAIHFDNGRGIAVHAAWHPGLLREEDPKKIRYYTQHGPSTGKRTPEGFPDRIDWSASYPGPSHVVFGHQVYSQPYRMPFATGIDTGCVFGGKLTALRYPDMELTDINSLGARAELGKPL